MGEESADPKGTDKSPAAPVKKGGTSSLGFHHIATLAVLVIVIVYNAGEFLKTPEVAEVSTNQSMFSVPSEISSRYDACNYKYLFLCELKSDVPRNCDNLTGLSQAVCQGQSYHPPAGCESLTGIDKTACIATDDGRAQLDSESHPFWSSVPFASIIYAAFEMLPHLPDAVIHMLRERWSRGSLEFSVGLFFVFAYVTLMVVALRLETRMSLIVFALVVVFGPSLLLGVLWLFQHALGEASAAANKIAAGLLSVLGLPACLAICIKHDAGAVAKVVREARRSV